MKVRLQCIQNCSYYKCYCEANVIMKQCFIDHFSNVKIALVILVRKKCSLNSQI